MMMQRHSILLAALFLAACATPSVSAFTVQGPRAATSFTTTSRSPFLAAQHHPRRNLVANMVSTEMENTKVEQKQAEETEMESTTSMETSSTIPSTAVTTTTTTTPKEEVEVEELSETKKLMQQVKDAGTAGIVSYALWELGFWALSVPVCVFGYYELTGHWPDLSNSEDTAKLGAEAFAFVNFARFAVPLRIGLALGTTPWIQANVLDRFFPKKDNQDNNMEVSMKDDADAAGDNKYL